VLTAAVGYGIVTINPTSLACGSETAGQTTSCGAGSVTVTATAGEVIFDANPFSLNDNTDFTVAAGTCANATLAIGQSCTSGAIAFSPVSATRADFRCHHSPSSAIFSGAPWWWWKARPIDPLSRRYPP